MARPYLFCQAGFEFFDHTASGMVYTLTHLAVCPLDDLF